jgi:hypothetical protein
MSCMIFLSLPHVGQVNACLISSQDERPGCSIWRSGGQHFGGQKSGGQQSGGQRSGGQHFGGQKFGGQRGPGWLPPEQYKPEREEQLASGY